MVITHDVSGMPYMSTDSVNGTIAIETDIVETTRFVVEERLNEGKWRPARERQKRGDNKGIYICGSSSENKRSTDPKNRPRKTRCLVLTRQ